MKLEHADTLAQDEGNAKFARRARYHTSGNPFTFEYPEVPVRQFLAERDRAFDAGEPTGLIELDCSDALATAYPATTPTLLVRYVKIRAEKGLRHTFNAGGEIFYVMSGRGESSNAGDVIRWSEGDLFCFPGGGETLHAAGDQECLLFAVTDEPLLAFEALRAPEREHARIETTY